MVTQVEKEERERGVSGNTGGEGGEGVGSEWYHKWRRRRGRGERMVTYVGGVGGEGEHRWQKQKSRHGAREISVSVGSYQC